MNSRSSDRHRRHTATARALARSKLHEESRIALFTAVYGSEAENRKQLKAAQHLELPAKPTDTPADHPRNPIPLATGLARDHGILQPSKLSIAQYRQRSELLQQSSVVAADVASEIALEFAEASRISLPPSPTLSCDYSEEELLAAAPADGRSRLDSTSSAPESEVVLVTTQTATRDDRESLGTAVAITGKPPSQPSRSRSRTPVFASDPRLPSPEKPPKDHINPRTGEPLRSRIDLSSLSAADRQEFLEKQRAWRRDRRQRQRADKSRPSRRQTKRAHQEATIAVEEYRLGSLGAASSRQQRSPSPAESISPARTPLRSFLGEIHASPPAEARARNRPRSPVIRAQRTYSGDRHYTQYHRRSMPSTRGSHPPAHLAESAANRVNKRYNPRSGQ